MPIQEHRRRFLERLTLYAGVVIPVLGSQQPQSIPIVADRSVAFVKSLQNEQKNKDLLQLTADIDN